MNLALKVSIIKWEIQLIYTHSEYTVRSTYSIKRAHGKPAWYSHGQRSCLGLFSRKSSAVCENLTSFLSVMFRDRCLSVILALTSIVITYFVNATYLFIYFLFSCICSSI